MKFAISTQELNYMIGKMQNVVPLKPATPLFANILVEAVNGQLILTATDLTVAIECSAEVKVLEEGATTLPAKRFAQLVREITAANIEISSNANEITEIVAGPSKFKLHGMSANEFPKLPSLDAAIELRLKQADLKDLIYRTAFAVSKDDNRYVLTGVSLQLNHGIATFLGTDGKRLARAYLETDAPPEASCQLVIPLKAVEEIYKNLNEEGEASFYLMQDKAAVLADDTKIVTNLLSGEYPDVSRVIPEKPELSITLHREELITLLRQISLFTSDKSISVKFRFGQGELNLAANTMAVGEGRVSMPANYQGDHLEVAFNPIFFLDILRHCKGEIVALGLTDPYNPALIIDQDAPREVSNQASPLYMIMPMRLSEE